MVDPLLLWKEQLRDSVMASSFWVFKLENCVWTDRHTVQHLHSADGRTYVSARRPVIYALVCITFDHAHAVPCLGAKIVIVGELLAATHDPAMYVGNSTLFNLSHYAFLKFSKTHTKQLNLRDKKSTILVCKIPPSLSPSFSKKIESEYQIHRSWQECNQRNRPSLSIKITNWQVQESTIGS